MVFEILRGKKKKEEEVPEEFKLAGPPFKKAEPEEFRPALPAPPRRELRPGAPAPGPAREAPPSRPYIPPEFAGERFPSRPEPRREETDRIALILNKLDIIESRLKIIEEKLK